MRPVKLLVILLGLSLVLMSCEKSKADKEMEQLDAYLLENNITVEPTSSGMYYIEKLKGSGSDVKGGDNVTVRYKGTFLDGEIFDSGDYTFPLGYGRVIKGWDEGINYMNVGGKAILIIPSNMAYGSSDYNGIPAYSTLVFEVELLKIGD